MTTIADLIREAYTHWNDAAALARAGCELHDRNRLDLAREVLARALELDAGDPDVWAHLAFAYLRGFQPARGLDVLRRGIERTGSDRLRATLLAYTSDKEEREALAKRLATSADPEIRGAVASSRLGAGETAAFEELRQLHREHPGDPYLRETWLWAVTNARFRGQVGDIDLHEEALPAARQFIAEEPDRVRGHSMEAHLLLADRDWDGLLTATEAALARFPDEETMMFLRGRAFREKGDHDRAVQCLARAVGMKPSFAGARGELARAYEAQGRLDLAEEVLREIPRANPGYAGGTVSLALFLGRQERWPEAETIFLDAWSRLETWQKTRLRQAKDTAPLFARERVRAGVGE
jgi:predicted Zn-dependent protease